MSHEEIRIRNQGYTDTSYASCGGRVCTEVILKCIGVTEKTLEEVAIEDINNLEMGGDTQVTVALLKESDECLWCATCATFLRHGISYPGEEIGCQHGPDAGDLPDLPGPRIDLQDRPAMQEYWGQA